MIENSGRLPSLLGVRSFDSTNRRTTADGGPPAIQRSANQRKYLINILESALAEVEDDMSKQ
jgi:hypothetical protein